MGVAPSIIELIEIFCDNEGAIALTKELKDHRKSKPIERKYHFIVVSRVSTEENSMDPFMKTLTRPKHETSSSYSWISWKDPHVSVVVAASLHVFRQVVLRSSSTHSKVVIERCSDRHYARQVLVQRTTINVGEKFVTRNGVRVDTLGDSQGVVDGVRRRGDL
ncbi:hypothetical protein OSB04_031952 [Centaurea solstitialis]|uniref:Uncharacterized protein n=1 Tax=Centaurea solstitialis TaxID=347529 RepID=A0AA38SA10_9ASTR|nr:hypothetical protein OSB04_031952 [Centaurea solstitialis]